MMTNVQFCLVFKKRWFQFNSRIVRTHFASVKVMLHEPIFNANIALKVSGGGVTHTNTNKIRATTLQVFESLSKTCNMLPQQNVALKIALCTLLHVATFNATMLR